VRSSLVASLIRVLLPLCWRIWVVYAQAVRHDSRAVPTTSVPLVDLRALHAQLKDGILADISSVIEDGSFVNGPAVGRFESDFAAWCGREHCVGLSSGLDALRLALIAAGAKPGDEVIVPANTFVASVEAISQARCTPVLVDATEADYNIDPSAVEAAVTDRTRFVMPVHLYGQMADMAALEALARRGLALVEDAAQAHGATREGRRAGGAGLVGCFSFYPAKNLGAIGDAGACVTDDAQLADRLRALREHGQSRKHAHEYEGYTARLDTIQAVALLHKLPLVEGWNDERRTAARYYAETLGGVGDVALPPVAHDSQPVWHVYVIRTADPEAMAAFLRERAIGTGRHYPQPVHLSPAYAHLGYEKGTFPVTEDLAAHGLSLPIFPGISEPQLEAVVRAISEFFEQRP
jgi:dTDP-4-amino-4,6-dideoxygalactose transaminase